MKVLITLGPTQEPIDAIRYITNASSGKMGRALAKEALKRNFSTTIIAGPINIKLPKEAKILSIVTAKEMMSVTLKELRKENYDIFISVAAIADYSPEKISDQKIKSGEGELVILLKQNPKLTQLVRSRFPDLFMVGFKAEYDLDESALIKKALNKLMNDQLNLVIANDVAISKFGGDESEVFIVSRKGVEHLPLNKKEIIAKEIWDKILEREKTG